MDEMTVPSSDITAIRKAVAERFGGRDNVLGAQLGMVIRANLSRPTDLKSRYGGLKAFLRAHLGDLVRRIDSRGLDDVYLVGVSSAPATPQDKWSPVDLVPQRELWALVTNPSVAFQFSFAADSQVVSGAPLDAPMPEGNRPVKKLDRRDYEEIASEFADLWDGFDDAGREEARARATSPTDFNRWIRNRGGLPAWEQYRVQRAIAIFVSRLADAGAGDRAQQDWRKVLESSHDSLRQSRSHGPVPPIPASVRGSLDARSVISKALTFMSDDDVDAIQLPVGAVLKAIASFR